MQVYITTLLADGDYKTCLREAQVCLITEFTRKDRLIRRCYHNKAQFPKFKAENSFQNRI